MGDREVVYQCSCDEVACIVSYGIAYEEYARELAGPALVDNEPEAEHRGPYGSREETEQEDRYKGKDPRSREYKYEQ